MVFKQDAIPVGIELGPFWVFFSFFFLSLSMFQFLFLKNQLDHINTMLLVYS